MTVATRPVQTDPMQHESSEAAPLPVRQIRAAYTEQTVTVYQAYPPAIGEHAARHGSSRPTGAAAG